MSEIKVGILPQDSEAVYIMLESTRPKIRILYTLEPNIFNI